jgi:hypothetical protein
LVTAQLGLGLGLGFGLGCWGFGRRLGRGRRLGLPLRSPHEFSQYKSERGSSSPPSLPAVG